MTNVTECDTKRFRAAIKGMFVGNGAGTNGTHHGMIELLRDWALPILIPIFLAIAGSLWYLSITTSQLVVEVKNNTKAISSLKLDMKERMADRFTGTEGAELKSRVLYLERQTVLKAAITPALSDPG